MSEAKWQDACDQIDPDSDIMQFLRALHREASATQSAGAFSGRLSRERIEALMRSVYLEVAKAMRLAPAPPVAAQEAVAEEIEAHVQREFTGGIVANDTLREWAAAIRALAPAAPGQGEVERLLENLEDVLSSLEFEGHDKRCAAIIKARDFDGCDCGTAATLRDFWTMRAAAVAAARGTREGDSTDGP